MNSKIVMYIVSHSCSTLLRLPTYCCCYTSYDLPDNIIKGLPGNKYELVSACMLLHKITTCDSEHWNSG